MAAIGGGREGQAPLAYRTVLCRYFQVSNSSNSSNSNSSNGSNSSSCNSCSSSKGLDFLRDFLGLWRCMHAERLLSRR
ncbi:hypothetical protein ACSSS7_006167 [Eimeria intestinalis]